ncbi:MULTISPECIES: O-acetyl-ADP-ribose deacetylase [Pantoea]|jgi:O-acetyl-ADP-ribose deacetylase (regulator of RNase III)|uniref:O-acetyl-ADP-ribose deacetylase n=1 Tax=Pantoea piersonii TaxID=2364647 RepID=A0AAJ5QNB1_9GAMM|nr:MULTISPECIES: O-acetyl-ADP-ribose deacetylase [Pantoea]MBZ6386254.1 O-acetyl-ADP-ribose deacetylase [Pantoea piersonii]MBZ6401401.1 O-acetyl-ADP-ribose deacetylase [Pantoea piersonii]MBZ6409771.1 O-acetyl-ADP-ribose deacetylase [Pantoea piersonii]NYB04387.1 O-acetyl-ADP-ribose deacetylase [Pantoea piersonii]NYB08960.1 O-acetyl-ADP-ribose deacetylase [Pantoea piersonii]
MQEKITLVAGDITKINADAIVNAANSSLLGGGGVDGAIHRAGGPEIVEECKIIRNRQGGCHTGDAVITTAGKLPARYVIHTVGPVWNGGSQNEAELLKRAYQSCFRLAQQHDIKTIAFPSISTGIYRFPKKRAAEIALEAIRDALADNPALEEVKIVCFDEENFEIYAGLLN